MGPYLTLLLLLMVVIMARAGKYVYEQSRFNWSEAQRHCRTIHTDLAPISSFYDISLIRKLHPDIGTYSWIGLENTTRSSTGWMWSGGQEMPLTKGFWAPGEPNDWGGREDYVAIKNYDNNHLWVDVPRNFELAFLCYKVHAIRKRMTWYGALRYCRQNHQDLASVASETEMMLIKHELSKNLSSQNVWTGLHYLVDRWQWMDGQPFSYESWGPDPKPTCPDIHWACGAIRMKGPADEDTLIKVEGVKGWNALDCYRRLHFLCY